MFKKLIVFCFLFFVFSTNVYCAEGVTFTPSSKNTLTGMRILTITYETAANGSLTTATRISTNEYYGFVIKITHIKGSTPVTDDTADITLKDTNGVDIFGGALENIDTTNANSEYMSLVDGSPSAYPIPIPTTLQLDIASNVGASASGTIIIDLL